MKKERHKQDRTSEKLDIIAGLLQEIKEALIKPQSIKEKISYFSNENKCLTNKDISRTLGISERHVSKEKTLLKKEKNKRWKKKNYLKN